MKLQIKRGSYTDESLLYINAIVRRLGCTVDEAINYINEEEANAQQKKQCKAETDSKAPNDKRVSAC